MFGPNAAISHGSGGIGGFGKCKSACRGSARARVRIASSLGRAGARMIANVLSIAGSDPSGGAGVAADLKTFGALGCYGMAVITAVTAQNTCGVTAIHAIPLTMIEAQLAAVFEDVRVDAIKIGMLPSAEVARTVVQCLNRYPKAPVVLDPVMCSSVGVPLLPGAALATLRESLLPEVHLLTPNLLEAAALLATTPARNEREMEEQAIGLLAMGPRWVLLKGGHLGGESSPDVLAGHEGTTWLRGKRVVTQNDHGTGCTLSAAVAALLPRTEMTKAASQAKMYLERALLGSGALSVGRGRGPLQHFWMPAF